MPRHQTPNLLHQTPRRWHKLKAAFHMFSSVQLLNAAAYSAARGHDFPPHRHTCWELVFYREGRIEAPIGDEVFLTRPGVLLLTPPGVTHAERALTAYSNYYITLVAPEETDWPRSVNDDARGSLGYLFRALVEEYSSQTKGNSARLQHETESLLALLMGQLELYLRRAQASAPVPAGEQLVREAERIFEENTSQTLSMGGLANRIGVAPSVLRAHFATFRGYSPSAALFRVRLRQALSLLQSSDLSLREIATTCGFHSPSHLSRHVKAATGETPGAWRRNP